MKHRTSTLYSRADQTAGLGTKVIDVKIPDVISRIWVRFGVIVPATPTPTDTPAANVPKIEVVDGSDVLYSLTGELSQAVDFYDNGKERHNNGSYVPAWELIGNFYLNFGRFLWDEELALDPTKFNNLQIKVSYDEDKAVADVDTNYLSVYLDVFDEERPTPSGFLMNKELKAYTPGTSSWEYIDLPSDFPYRKLFIQGRVADKWLGALFEEFKLTEDNDRRIPLHMENEEFEQYLKDQFPRYREHIVADVDNTTGLAIFHTPTQGLVFAGSVYAASAVLNAVPFGYDNDIKSGDNIGYQSFSVVGDVPHGVVCIPLGDQTDINDWYGTDWQSLQLQVKSGASATGTYRVATQQMRSY